MTRGSLQVAAAVLLSNAVCLRKSLSWLLIYPRRVLAKKHLMATFADRPTLGYWKKEAGGRGRLSETGFDGLAKFRSMCVCAVAVFECCSKRLSWFQWPTWISVFQLFGSGGPWYDVSFSVSRKCYVFHRIFVWHFVYSAGFLHSAV